jgi:polyvinyl alcohol dehydrogenase (cytochrome)
MLAFDKQTGALLWATQLDEHDAAIITQSATLQGDRVYVVTGNNYCVPESVKQCVIAAGNDTNAVKACLAPDDFFDTILALDMRTGAVRRATKALPYDTWIAARIGFGDPNLCPEPASPDCDFGQAPALLTVQSGRTGAPSDVVGAGQKSGKYWALDSDTGAVKWVTQAGPGGTWGSMQWGSGYGKLFGALGGPSNKLYAFEIR